MKDIQVSGIGSALHPAHSLECRQCGEEYDGEAAKAYLAEVDFVNADGRDEAAHVCYGRCLEEFQERLEALGEQE